MNTGFELRFSKIRQRVLGSPPPAFLLRYPPVVGSAGYPAGDGGEPLLPRLPHHEALPVLLRSGRGRVGHRGTPLPNVVGRPGGLG